MSVSKGTLAEAAELAHFGVAELNADGCFVAMDEAYLAMLGKEAANLLGRHWRASVHPEDHGRVEVAYRQARANGQGYAEIRALRNDSTVVHQALTVTCVSDDRERFTGYRCLRRDISSYRQEQDALILAVESAPNGLLMLNSAGLIQSVNRAVEELFQYQRSKLIGRKVEMLLPEHYRSRHVGQRDRFINNKETNATMGRDLVGLRSDGVEIPLQVYLNRIDTHDGELILCTIIDIAERVRYQHQLELAKQAAEAANRAKSDFLARMSHEIRTPMNLIMGMNSLLLDSALTDKQRRHLEISNRNVRRLLRLINGILDLSKVEAGMLTLNAVPFDLGEVINECAATMSQAIERKGLTLEMSIDPDVWPCLLGDAERLQQLLLNLIGNSVKFTAQGKIELRVHSEGRQEGRQGLRFEVTDTGCGVPPNKADLIFEAFQQAEGSMSRAYEGTGLGLSISRMLVELMSGKIWVEAKPAPGAKFVFTAFFPIARKEDLKQEPDAAGTNEKAQALASGTRILLVEDNHENMVLLQAYLSNLSVSLHFASNGVEAVRERQRGTYNLVLMDIQMPVMDGYTATREIRTWEKSNGMPRVPIVALTAHALSGASSESMDAGCDAHLTKPVERRDLVAAIVKYSNGSPGPEAMGSGTIAARRSAFLSKRRLDLEKMNAALAARDFQSIQTIGHDCKGIGTGYGFPGITRIGSAIEIAAIALDLAGTEELIYEFEKHVTQCLAESIPREQLPAADR